MKRVVSVSLGSSGRDHRTVQEFNGRRVLIERIGVDGDREKAMELIKSLDGAVDAFGLGGTDLYIYAGPRRYTFRESARIAAAARQTPLVDGSGLKNTLERRVIRFLQSERIVDFRDRPILVVSAMDRFGMAEALVAAGSRPVFGDLMFGLGLELPIRSLRRLDQMARLIAPVVTRLPVRYFYPTGRRQTEIRPRFGRYFAAADVIAGDFHFIRRHLPDALPGKIVITNTVTPADEALLKERGAALLVTTTPAMDGRSFGANTLEAVLVALSGRRPEELSAAVYEQMLDQLAIRPRVTRFSAGR